ncbi:MAG: FAD-dependent oxidoreductase [Undibacterium sp.]|nr:FAD-dependent oxidoreductase [Opitutaceae bacterium]
MPLGHFSLLRFLVTLASLVTPFFPLARAATPAPLETEICVYGGTAGAVIAAVQAAQLGRSVILVSPDAHLGGLSSGGLGQTDIGNKRAIGGLARQFYERIAQHYARPEAWAQQTRASYKSVGQSATEPGEPAMWTFEPHVAEKIFEDYVRENKLTVLRRERLDLARAVEKTGARLTAIRLESGRVIRAKMFIDATYEGDLMAKAGVSYRVGREANSEFGETLNGVQTQRATAHQFFLGVSPYVVPGAPASGLLPGVAATGPGAEGSADARVQAYNFRLCLTDFPENRIPFTRPADYDERTYEVLLRNFEAGLKILPLHNAGMPNRKTDTNNNTGFSTDFIGENYSYPDADYATRDRIRAAHLSYHQGLAWTLANHPRVPDKIRTEAARWGVTRDEFTDNAGWPTQLYIREARRMTGAAVMTELHCTGRAIAPDAVGLGAYSMDSHNTQRYVDAAGHVRNEGDVQVKVLAPYPIAYDAITPRATECENLLVPVALSATHIAYGSIRMEPVFMVLGQSAATAADHAITQKTSVQKIDRAQFHEKLLAEKQVLAWTASAPKSAPNK